MKFLFGMLILMSSLMAGSGKAIIPYWSSNVPSGLYSFFTISNTTDHDIVVTIKFYDKDGQLLAPSSFSNFQAGNTQIAPKSSGTVKIESSISNAGFGVIEWENLSGDDDAVALVAQGVRSITLSGYRADVAIDINNGRPF